MFPLGVRQCSERHTGHNPHTLVNTRNTQSPTLQRERNIQHTKRHDAACLLPESSSVLVHRSFSSSVKGHRQRISTVAYAL